MVDADLSAVSRILFLGSKSIGRRILRAIVTLAPGSVCAAMTIDDSGDSRSQFRELQATAAAADVSFHVARARTDLDALVRREQPDLCVVAGWYWIVAAETLDRVPRGFIGIHNSLLPKYRGGAPLVWALINGETEVGASVFSLRPGADDGPVWMQARISIGRDEYIGEVLERLEEKTLGVFTAGFPGILAGTLIPAEQDHGLATYCAQRCADDGEIDWSRPADAVFNFIRAQSPPYPGAFTVYDGTKLTITRARPLPHRYDGTPGQITERDAESIVVACGAGSALRVDEVRLNGGAAPAGQVVRTTATRFPRCPAGRKSGLDAD